VIERTLAIIKPDAVSKKYTGKIIDMIEEHGFTILRMQKLKMAHEHGKAFYAVHKDRPFFNELVDFISSGPVVVLALEKENAVKAWRDLMGATNPADAAEGTVRKLYAESIGKNAVHGSDSADNAAQELRFFFHDL
jgi:nucleoside-diphosphate kinase